MRKLICFTLGFVLSCLAGVYLEISLAGSLCALLAGATLLCLGKERRLLRQLAVFLVGIALGMGWFGVYSLGYLNRAEGIHGKTLDAVIRTRDYSWETDYGRAVDGTIDLGGKHYQVRAYLEPGPEIAPGENLSGAFSFKVTTPDAMEGTYYSGKGIWLVAYQEGFVKSAPASADWQDGLALLRRKLDGILEQCIPADALPFARSLLLGDRGDLGYDVQTDLTVSGIRHVVSVSGFHVSILYGLLCTVTMKKRYWTAFLGFPVLFLFAGLAGFAPSVVRSCIMSGLLLGALALDREYDGPAALSFAVLCMCLGNPMVVGSVSFQLSVVSVLGIFLFHGRIYKWFLTCFGGADGKSLLSKCKRTIASSVALSLSATVMTAPLTAVYFDTVSLIGVVSNLLTLWVVSGIFYGVLAVCGLYWISAAGAMALGSWLAWPVRGVLWLADKLAKLPMAAVYTESLYITLWLGFVYLLLAVFLCQQEKKPGTLLCCGVLGLCLALTASWVEPMLDGVRFTVLDVGQGQSLIFQQGGKTILVDCGGDDDGEAADTAAEALLSMGVSQLDAVIVTHLDDDHAGGIANLLSRVDTRVLILPEEHTDLGSATAGEVIFAAEDLEIQAGESTIRIFAPTFPGNSNEKSLCILFDTEKCDILVTGDRNGFGERMLLRNADIPDVDILVAGHHGAAGSTCEELLAAVCPEIVCISAGEDNPYGHPAKKLLERLREYNCTVYRTDQQGTITIRR